MSFIKLSRDNFVNSKIKNSFNIKYVKNDIETHICDKNIKSKSLIYSQGLTYNDIDENLLGIPSDEDTKTDINVFFNVANDSELNFSNVFDSKKSLIDRFNVRYQDEIADGSLNEITNENLKSYNLKNYFNIERVSQKFLIDSIENSKINTVKNNLYDFYRKDMTKDYYPELSFGYCNYNSLNFFSQKIQDNNLHSNCVVYSNQYNGVENEISFLNDFTLNFSLNVRKYTNNKRSCLLHIPNIISIYVIELLNSYSFCITTGSNSNLFLNNVNFPNVDFLLEQDDSQAGCYLISSNRFDYNKWYNINMSFYQNKQNSDMFNLIIKSNSETINNLEIEVSSNIDNNFNSYICIGNKPDYKKADDSINTNFNEIFYTFFGKNYTDDGSDGPFYTKDINLGNSTAYDDAALGKNINQIINDENLVFFNETEENSSSFSGEISDFKIYNTTLNEENISELYKSNISDLELHKSLGLIFYLPLFYLPLFVKKQGNFNNIINNTNLYYSNIYNPYYANTSGGLDISVENYLVDVVSIKKPNVIINGSDRRNIYSNFHNSFSQILSNNFQKIKKGIFSAEIEVETIDENITNNENLEYSSGSNFYRNLLLLPCDNGIPNISFNIINQIINDQNIITSQQNYDNNYPYNIDCTNCLSGHDNIIEKNITLPTNSLEYAVSSNGELELFLARKDACFNISNYIFHDEVLSNQNDILNTGNKIIQKELESLKLKYKETDSNPVLRRYNDSDLRIENSLLEEDGIIYKDLPLPYYDFTSLKHNMFSSLFDISSAYYNLKIKKGTFNLQDTLIGTNNQLNIRLSDNSKGLLYRNDCLTKVATWNYVGNIFYKEGIALINNPSLFYLGKVNFNVDFASESSLFIHETDIIINKGIANSSNNKTYNPNLRIDESAFNSDEPFVYISDVNLHDENFNIIAKARLANPIPKKNTDNIMIKLKMDY